MDVFSWLLVSLVVCLESLHGQSTVTLAPQAMWLLACVGTYI